MDWWAIARFAILSPYTRYKKDCVMGRVGQAADHKTLGMALIVTLRADCNASEGVARP